MRENKRQSAQVELLTIDADQPERPVPDTGAPSADWRRLIQRGLFRNSAAIFSCRALAIGASLVSVPVVIRCIGMQGYGIWESLLAIAALAAVPQAVLGGALLWKISNAFGAGAKSEISRLARAGTAVTVAYAALALPVVLLVRRWLVHVLHIPGAQVTTAEFILPGMLLLVLLGGVSESFGAIIRGCQRTGLMTAIQTIATILNAAVTITCLTLGHGLFSLLYGFVAAFVTTLVASFWFARRLCPELRLFPSLPRIEDLRSSKKYAGCLLLGSASSSLRAETDKLVLATFASVTWVGYYAVAARIASLVMETSNFFYVPTIAAVGAMHGRKDRVGIQALYSRLMLVVPLAAGAVVAMVAGSAKEIMLVWIRAYEPQVLPILLLLLCGSASAVLLTGPGTCVCKGTGRIEIEATYIAVCLAVNLGLTIILVASLGAIGTVIATAVSWAVGSFFFVYIFDRRLGFSFRECAGALKCLLGVVPVVLLDYRLLPHLAIGEGRWSAFLALAVNSLGILAMYGLLMILLGVVPFERSKSILANFCGVLRRMKAA